MKSGLNWYPIDRLSGYVWPLIASEIIAFAKASFTIVKVEWGGAPAANPCESQLSESGTTRPPRLWTSSQASQSLTGLTQNSVYKATMRHLSCVNLKMIYFDQSIIYYISLRLPG